MLFRSLIKPRKRYLYPCHCIHYDGAEVDFRTQENYTNDKSLWNSEDTRKNQEDTITASVPNFDSHKTRIDSHSINNVV